MPGSLIVADRYGRVMPTRTRVDGGADALVGPSPRRGGLPAEIGTTGLRQYGGWVFEEWMPRLQGRQGMQSYREMLDNDPVCGAVLFAVHWTCRAVNWRVEAGRDAAAAELVRECMHDMEHTWGDFVTDALSFLPYGWALHEIVYKRRDGHKPGPDWRVDESSVTPAADTFEASSDYTDGKIGWRKLAGRAQETLLHWHFTGYGDPTALVQLDWHGGEHVVPLEKSLLFRTTTARGNPEGRSILRNAITSFWAVKHLRALEGIGVERDLAGIPVMKAPEGVDIWAPGNAALYQKAKTLVTNLRNDEYSGVVMNNGWDLQLLSAGGAKQMNVDAAIRRYRQDIALSMLADFVLLGQDAVGSFALAEVKSDVFGTVLDGVLDLICETLNRVAVPQLLMLNGFESGDPDMMPRIEHGSARKIDVDRAARFLQSIGLAGAPIPWTEDVMRALFTDAGLPASFDGPRLASTPESDPSGRPSGAGRVTIRRAESDGIAEALRTDADRLTVILQHQLEPLLDQLGDEAASAYLACVQKASVRDAIALAGRVMGRLRLSSWAGALRDLLRRFAQRVVEDTDSLVRTRIGVQLGQPPDFEKIVDAAVTELGMRDIEPQVREAIVRAIEDGLTHGHAPVRTAQQIREMVPADVFVHAGPAYRARLIARDQTLRMQRAAALALYRTSPQITKVELRDGIFGPPRSDSECIARDGDVVPIRDAGTVHPFHPQCTLGFLPVVSPALPTLVAA